MPDTMSNNCIVMPGVSEQPVEFDVNGAVVRGIISRPVNGPISRAVIFSHGWSGNRNGPAGILTYVARELSAAGCYCLRFDFRGRGESGGDGLASSLSTMSDDLVAGVKVLLEKSGLQNVVLFGMCSGGNIAIGSLKRIPEVDAMFMLSVYPFSDGDSFGRDVHRFWHFLNVYFHKACSLESWRRVFRGDASLARVFKVIFKPFLKRNENKVHETGQEKKSHSVKASNSESRLQNGREAPKKYLANLRKEISGIMVYGTADPDAPAALDYYGKYVKQEDLPILFRRIDGANHNFSSYVWHRHIAEMAVEFLKLKGVTHS